MLTRIDKIKSLLEEINIGNVDLESNLISIPFRHYEFELNSKTTPLIWHILANDENKTVRITIDVDKKTLASKHEADNMILDTLRNNKDFKEFVNALNQFEPNNETIKTMYKLTSWSVTESENDIKYTKNIQLGV
jgi:hypothetical protein